MQNIKSNINTYYIFSFLSTFTLFSPYIIYYLQDLSIRLNEIAILVSIFSITAFIFEIPSGYIADKIGRKNSLVISGIIQIASMVILYLGLNFNILIFAYLLLGISSSFRSGADSALLYDTLLVKKQEKKYKKIEGKSFFYSGISGIIACIAGSFIAKTSIPYTILGTIFIQIITLIITFRFKEPNKHKKIEKLPLKKEISLLRNIIIKSLKNKKLLGIFIYSFIIMGIADIIYLNYQPYLRAVNVPPFYFGFIFAALSIITSLTALKADYIEKKLGIFGSLIFMPIALIGALFGAGIFFAWYGFFFFLLRELTRGFIFPILGDYTNKLVESKNRATVLSVRNMFSTLGFAIISIIFGFIGDSSGLKIMLLSLGGLTLIFTIIMPFVITRNKKT